MILLLIGLFLFLGIHSLRIFAARPREAAIARLGPGPWKGVYSAVSAIGFVLIIVGYGQARGQAPLWPRPAGVEHATAGLVIIGFTLVVAAYWPRNHIKALVRDPMVLGVAAWALGHLLVKSSPAALALFGGFLLWAVLDYVSLRLRPAEKAPTGEPDLFATAGTLFTGAMVGRLFMMFGHRLLIGVNPF